MVSRFEIGKDTVQELTESAATHVGRIATILAGAVREVTHEVGEWATDVFEMNEAAAQARAANERDALADRDAADRKAVADPDPVADPEAADGAPRPD